MTDVEAILSEGVTLLKQLKPLLAVPAFISLLNFGEFLAVLDHRGSYIGIEFPLPAPVGDLWTFVNTPQQASAGIGLTADGFLAVFPLAIALVVAICYFLLYALLAAGYLGSIQQYRVRGSYDFLANAKQYAITYVALAVILYGSMLVLVGIVAVMPPLLVILLFVVLAIGYLFWGAWFLVPVANVGAIEALVWSYDLATTESDYVVWTLAHVVLGAMVSLLATWLVVTASVVGLLIALAGVVPFGFVLTVGSLRVVDDLVRGRGRSRTNPGTTAGLGPRQ